MAIQGQDYETIQQMIGTSAFPVELVEEYDIRIRMLAIAGGGYSLGPIGCVDLCRFVGMATKQSMKKESNVDWSQVKDGTDIVVDESGLVRCGKFVGTSEAGCIMIKYDGVDWVSEAYAKDVRIAVTDDFLPKVEAEEVPVLAQNANCDRDCDPSGKIKWSMVAVGTPIETIAGDDVLEYEYLGLASEKGCIAVQDAKTKHRYVLDAKDVYMKPEPVEV